MKTQAVIIADDPVYREWLQRASPSLEVTLLPGGEVAEVLARIEALPRVDLLFCEFDSHKLAQRAALIERFLERHWQIPVVGLGTEENPDWVLAAMRSGARDFFVLRRDDATLGVQIGRLLRRALPGGPGGPPAPKTGRLYAVLSGHPGVAIAFLAEHLALAIAQTQPPNQRTLLIDLATPAGGAAVFLNLKQTYSVLDALGDAHRCDQTLVDTAFTRHASGIYVLSLPEDLLGPPPVDADALLHLLTVLRGLFGHVVLALDGHLPLAALVGVVREVDRLVLLSDQSILRSRHNRHVLRALRQEGCGLENAGLVVDDYRKRLGLEPPNLAQLFELPLLAVLQTENLNRVLSMNSGEPLFTLARKDPYCAGVRALAEVLAAPQLKSQAVGGGLLSKLVR
jgi:pilus assembly protein CpaE